MDAVPSAEDIANARDKADRLFEVDQFIQTIQLDLALEEEYAQDFTKTEEYRSVFFKFINKKEEFQLPENEGSVASGTKKSITLPQLKLPSFNGDPKHWVNFWSAFETIHDDEQLGEGQKLST